MVAQHKVVSHDEWTQARKAFLAREKAFSRQREALARERSELPWEEVTKDLCLRRAGRQADAARSVRRLQPACRLPLHVPARVGRRVPALLVLGRQLQRHRPCTCAPATCRLPRPPARPSGRSPPTSSGWAGPFPGSPSGETDFNYDFGASFTPEEVASHAAVFNYGSEPGFEDREGISIFVRKRQGRVFHSYSTYARGIDAMNSAYQFLDLTPKGRDEPAGGDPQFWVRRHDEYGS